MEVKSPALKDVSSNKPSPLPPSPPLEEPSAMDTSTEPVPDTRHKELTPAKEPSPQPTVDVEMTDVDVAASKPPEPTTEELPDAPRPETPLEASCPPAQPSAPPWSASTAAEPSPKSTSGFPSQSVDVDVETPVKQDPASTAGNLIVFSAPNSAPTTENTAAPSPAASTIASPFSPAVNNAVKPTPARKKLSLSDYTNRNRKTKLAQTQSTGSNATPPLATSQSTSSPTLSAASLPNTNSPPPKAVEPVLAPVAEESKPAEVSVAPTIAATSTST
jgi:hypothetical protein